MFLSCWFGILALPGIGKRYFNHNNRITRYLSSRSFTIYLFHFVWVGAIQFYASRITQITLVIIVLSVVGGFVLTMITCEIACQFRKLGNIIVLRIKHKKSLFTEGKGDLS